MDFDTWRKKKYEDESAPANETTEETPDEAMDFDAWRKKKHEKNTQDKWYSGFLQTSDAFKDGYQVGDIAKTILGTDIDIATNSAAGVAGWGEELVDAGATALGVATESIGMHGATKKLNQFVKKDLYDEKEVAKKLLTSDMSMNPSASMAMKALYGLEKWLNPNGDDNSVLGDASDQLIQSAAETVSKMAMPSKWAANALTGLTVLGGQAEQALREDANFKEAGGSALISAAAEILFEKISGAVSFGGKTLDDGFTKLLAKNISNVTLRTLSNLGLDIAGEAFEEVATEFVSKLGTMLYEEEDLGDVLFSKDSLNEYIQAAIGGGLMGGAFNVPGAVGGVKNNVDYKTGMTNEEFAADQEAEKVVDALTNEQIAEEEKGGKTLTSKEKRNIRKSIEKLLERGELNTEDIERIVGGEDYTKYKAETERQEKLQKEEKEILDSLRSPDNRLVVTKDSIEKQKRLEELRTMKSDQNMVDALKSSLDERIAKATSSGRLAESYENRARRGQAFKADLSKYKGKALETVRKAIKSGVLNDTRRTHELVDLVAKIAEDKGIDIDFTNNQRLAESGFAINGKQVNGFINANGITLNANSAKALNMVVGHEITHAFEGTELYESLSKAVTEYSKSKGEYDSRLKELTEIYKGVKDADVQKELVADLVGDYIFADEAFVRNLHAGDRNLFQKIFDEVKYLCKVATAGSEQEKQLLEVKRMFEKVYREGEASATTSGDGNIVELEGGTVTKNSLSTWTPETQERVKQDLVKAGYPADKVDSWIKDTNSVAAVIAADKDRLDFTAADNQIMLKDNQEYIKTLDASTLCAKRLIYQGTFDAIQHRLPNQMLSSDELIDLLNMMKKHKVQTPCGVCYVESRRRHLGKFAQDWLNGYNGAYKPNLDEVTTSDGLEKLRKTHPDTYKDFVDAMNKKGSSNPKVVQLRTEYRNEIMSLTPAQISKIEAIGGLRVQSFSDFETPHMLDMMQAVMDMSAKKLHSQAYTKVPNFAWIFGDTGIKINLSLIAEGDGFDADGRLAFSSTEGMDFDEAMLLRDAYSANVGTIIVGANDKHILACMADDRIDFIIPFHRSGWGSKELHLMGMDSYTDYTYGQKEHDLATGKGLANLYPPDYWDYNLTGKENAERYLKLCAQTGREPKFSKFLVDNGDGSYSLQPDGSTDGYWKMLIDFKMYDNNGVGAPQQIVQPTFNMEQAYRVLEEYEGGANELPVANEVVEEFVAKYRAKDIAPTAYSLSPETLQGVDRIALENIAPTREQIAEMKRVTTPAKKVDTLPMREDIAPKPKVKMQPSQQVATTGNNIAPPVIGKERSFAKTAIKSDAVDEKVSFADLSQESTHYVPVTNAVTLTKADDKLVRLGYDKAVKHVNAQINAKKVSLEDIALGERLIQEAVRRGDTKTAAELIQNVAILGTELGQKVQALSIIKRLTPAGQLRMLEKVVERGKARGDKAFECVELTQEMKDEILKTYNEDGVSYDQDALNKAVEDVKQRLADKMKVTTMERLNAWRYLAMLGNPKTHIRNIVSNVAMLATSSVKNAVSKSIEPIFSKDSRTKTWGKATQSVKTFADNTATEEKDNITGDGKYSESASIKDKRKLFRLGVLNKLYGLNNDLLAKEDWWFSKTTYKNSLAEFLTANGIKTADDIKKNPELVERGKQYAMEQAQIATFRQYSYIASKIGEIERKNAATEIAIGAVLPFKKTPINIAKTALNYSPLGFAKTITYDAAQVKSKKMEASTLIDHLAQNLTGTSLVFLGYALAKAGFINGAGDDDKEGEYDYQLGKQAYSVNIGGSTYSLSWLSPTAMPLFIGANAFEILEEKQEWNGDVVVDTLAQTLDPLSEMSFLSSLDDVLSSYDSGVAKFAGIASSAAQSYVSQYIPTLVSQVASVTDDKKRTTKVASDSDFKFADQTINQLFYKIPGLRQTLEPSTDIWGKTIYQNDDIVGRAVETFIAPWSRKELIANEIDAEIKELYSISGDTGVIPSIPANHFVHEKVKYEMSDEEYTEYKQVYGRTANILLERLFATSEYKNASAKQKTACVKKVYDIAKDDAKENFLEGRED